MRYISVRETLFSKREIVGWEAKGAPVSGQPIEEEFEDGVVAHGVGIVRIFIASGNLKDTLFEYVFGSKVDTTRITRICQEGRQRTSETELVIDIFEQDETGIGREAATIEVELNGFVPNRCKE